MANMLLRTKGTVECKYKLSFYVRVVLFFGIPIIYFLATGSSETVGASHDPSRYQADEHEVFKSRHLLALHPNGANCTHPAIFDFPPDGFTRSQRQKGVIAIHCVLAIYCFLLLSIVCEQYFVPAMELMCERLDMAEDIAGATFMAAASSSPELFINCVGTFVTEGDLGIGAIVGSAVFNVLAVPACCGLIISKVVELDWWSVSRDCLMYAVAVVALILCMLDDRIYWHEAMLLVLMYTLYILTMVFNSKLGTFMRSTCCIGNKQKMYTEITPLLLRDKLNSSPTNELNGYNNNDVEQGIKITKRSDSTGSETSPSSVWLWPGDESTARKCLWLVTWPVGVALWASVPDCRRYPRFYFLTFIMCISWIAGVSYLVAWLITVLGDTLNVPDSIVGLTVLAAGTSLPEAVSSVLVTMQGHGTMGISNSIGSNTFDILLCLGLPWLIKSLFYPSVAGNYWVEINSKGLSYISISLLSMLFVLYGCLALNKFQLDWRVGVTCAVVYLGFLLMATLIELNVFFVVNLPICPH